MSKPSVDPEITAAEVAAMQASEPKKRARIDPETARAYSDYLKNWRWNMATHFALQREYMGRNYSGRNENLF